MKTIYISGPMTGMPDHNFPAFHAEAARLRALGYEVVNPAEINSGLVLQYHEYLIRDIKAMCDCDTIAVLPGWEKSHGARFEVRTARKFKFPVLKVSDINACAGIPTKELEVIGTGGMKEKLNDGLLQRD